MEGKKVNSKLLLFTLVLVLIVLLLLNKFLDGLNTNDIWNYKKLTSAQDIIQKGKIVTDREIYYNLEEIITKYVESYLSEQSTNLDMINYKDYYTFLIKDYKKHLSQEEYNNVAETFLNKFYVKNVSEWEAYEYMDVFSLITNIYSFDNNIYLCKLYSKETRNTGYIAIKLDLTNEGYYIVYIE